MRVLVAGADAGQEDVGDALSKAGFDVQVMSMPDKGRWLDLQHMAVEASIVVTRDVGKSIEAGGYEDTEEVRDTFARAEAKLAADLPSDGRRPVMYVAYADFSKAKKATVALMSDWLTPGDEEPEDDVETEEDVAEDDVAGDPPVWISDAE